MNRRQMTSENSDPPRLVFFKGRRFDCWKEDPVVFWKYHGNGYFEAITEDKFKERSPFPRRILPESPYSHPPRRAGAFLDRQLNLRHSG